jgi:ABC-type branched-subunit amino acid transport system ATPase component
MTELLVVHGIAKRFGGLHALTGCTLSLEAGRITGLIGPNGAGKTTLLNVVTGLVQPDSGTVSFRDADVTGFAPSRLATRGLARTFQIARELGSLTVFENLLLAPPAQRGEAVMTSLLRRRRWWAQEHENAAKAKALLERIGLWTLADQPSSRLSGGQKKLLDIARALLLEPSLILLDEPGAGVSPPLKQEIIRLIRDLKADGMSFGLVEHDMHLIAELCDHVHVLTEGRVLLSGSFDDVASDKRVVDAYLGIAA